MHDVTRYLEQLSQIDFAMSMPNSGEALAVWTHELPDGNLELYPQHRECPLQTFTRFPQLPEELRLMIYRAAFPVGRTVQVELSPSHEILHSHTPPPPTLLISRESRRESLRHYIPLIQPARRRIWFNPELDTVYFHRHNHLNTLFFLCTSNFITHQSLSGIAKIQSLKIKKLPLDGFTSLWTRFGFPHCTPFEQLEANYGGLRFFRGLKELIVVAGTVHPYTAERLEPITSAQIEQCQQDFKEYFEWERRRSPMCKIPEVIVRREKNPRQDRWYLGRLDDWFED
jgi:hypothetical protein